MLIQIIYMALLLCPTVSGQTEQFEQECSILQTLETLEARLQKQEALLGDQATRLEEQKKQLGDQATRLGDQATQLDDQATQLGDQATQLEEQKTQIGEQKTLLVQQDTRLLEQEKEITTLRQQTSELRRLSTSATYVRWGRTTCPGNGSELVYSGYAGGSWYDHTGAAVDYLCLPTDPSFAYYEDKLQSGAMIYGAEYEMHQTQINEIKFFPDNDPDVSLANKDVPCAVCKTTRSTVLMVPARTTCHGGWTLEYTGYLSAGRHTHVAASQYVCLDGKPESLYGGGTSDDNGKLFYFVEGRCGSLRCPPYVDGRELTCAVCSI